MMARTGMATNISAMRRFTNAGTADATVNGVAYWTDDQLQEILDRYRQDFYHVPMLPVPEMTTDGSTQWTTYRLPDQAKYIEEYDSESIFRVYKADGTNAGTADYTVNYERRVIEFDADQQNVTWYVDFSAFNVNRAAAEVWESKAAFVVDNVDWSSDNHRISASQEYEHCMKQAARFKAMAGTNVSKMTRSDMRPTVRNW